MEEIQVVFRDLPATIKGFTLYDGIFNYTIVLNSKLNCETQTITYQHELSHIIHKDFDSMIPVDNLEKMRHE